MSFRHEINYKINPMNYLVMKRQLTQTLHCDPNANRDGRYSMRSIYFNLFEKGTAKDEIFPLSDFEAFRLRYYNDDHSSIFLEKKQKQGAFTYKSGCKISETEARLLINGHHDFLKEKRHPLALELHRRLGGQPLDIFAVEDCVREAYYYEPGGVRVVFDMSVKNGPLVGDPFAPQPQLEEILDASAMVMMVKYKDCLPPSVAPVLKACYLGYSHLSPYASRRSLSPALTL